MSLIQGKGKEIATKNVCAWHIYVNHVSHIQMLVRFCSQLKAMCGGARVAHFLFLCIAKNLFIHLICKQITIIYSAFRKKTFYLSHLYACDACVAFASFYFCFAVSLLLCRFSFLVSEHHFTIESQCTLFIRLYVCCFLTRNENQDATAKFDGNFHGSKNVKANSFWFSVHKHLVALCWHININRIHRIE